MAIPKKMEKLIVKTYSVFDRDEVSEDEYAVENYKHAQDLANLLFKSHMLGTGYISREYYFEHANGNRSKFVAVGNNDKVWLQIDEK